MSLPTYHPSIVTSVLGTQQNLAFPRFVIGGVGQDGGTSYSLFKKGTQYRFNVWRSPVYNIGHDFDVLAIKFSVMPRIGANMSIIPVLYFDNEESSSVGTTINNTTYPNSEKLIKLTSKSFGNAVHGRNNFFLELQFTGSALIAVELPLTIELEVEDLS